MKKFIYFFSTFMTLFIVSYLGYNSSKKVRNSEDFSVGGRRLSSIQVSGSIIATIVGGASTIGTAQLAFSRGINAMWFTLGASIACLFLGVFLAGPLRRAQVNTISEFLVKYYGNDAGIIASILTSLAIFIHIIGQMLSSVAIFTSMFSFKETSAAIITTILIVSYIVFGGFWGTSIVGILKTFLLYSTLIICSIFILRSFNGFNGLFNSFPKEPWFNIFNDGVWEGLAQGISMVVGISATQTYLQAMFAGKNSKNSRNGAFISALLIPPIGLICTLIGMFMRANHPYILDKQALPTFIFTYLNPWIGGIMIAALIISVVGTGAGLTLGISTMITKDIYIRFISPKSRDIDELKILRLSVLVISISAMIMVILNIDSVILKWGFLSMALRGTVIFIPLIFAIYFKDKVNKKAGILSMIVSPIITIIWAIFRINNIEPLYIGILTSVLTFILYYVVDFFKSFIKSETRVK